MTQQTNYKRSFSGSMGAGMKSVFGASGRRFYELEFRTGDNIHRSGDVQKVIVDEIEIGRSKECGVRIGEDCKTVSRRHAAIIKDGNGWKLVHLSTTNSTYLNGRKIEHEWYLQNGDEIQLSTDGPRIGFLVKEGKGSLVKSINLTARLSLFRQQALRPYKRALLAVAAVLVAVVISGTFVILNMDSDLEKAVAKNAELEELVSAQQALLDKESGRVDSLKAHIKKVERRIPKPAPPTPLPVTGIEACNNYVYHIQSQLYIEGEWIDFGTSTGFLLDDGRFVTAAHCVSNFYLSNYCLIRNGRVIPRDGIDPQMVELMLLFNVMEQRGALQMRYVCESPNDKITFTNNDMHTYGGSRDEIHTLSESFGKIPAGTSIRIGASGCYDWAWFHTQKNEGLKSNADLSTNLKQGTQLYILGYPHGWGKGNPILSSAMCSQNGVSEELGGAIMASNDNTEGGNSGGPVFVNNNNEWQVVALISGSTAAKGRFVPIASVK